MAHRREFLRTRKPSSAAKMPPHGHKDAAVTCPTCKGTGSVTKKLAGEVGQQSQNGNYGQPNPASLVTRSVGRIK